MTTRIGIVTKEFEDLPNWQLRIIDGILKNKTLELVLLIQENKNQGLTNIPQTNFFSKISFNKKLLSFQLAIEKKLFFKEKYTIDKKGIIKVLQNVPSIKMTFQKMEEVGSKLPNDIKKVQEQNLDIILKLDFDTVPCPIANLTKFGIWAFLPSDHTLPFRGPVGFWEIRTKKPAIGFSLLKITTEIDEAILLDTAFFNRHWSCTETKNLVLEASVSVFMKNIKKLPNKKTIDQGENKIYLPTYKAPSLSNIISYVLSFYFHLFSKIMGRVSNSLFGIRYECWTFYIGSGVFLETGAKDLVPLRLPKNEFWADPFLFKHKGMDYVFFENFSYKTKRGKISCGIINDNDLVDVVDVLDCNYHLSFPYIFEENGAVYLMPETSENGRLEIYKCVEFPSKWKLYSTAFEGELVADAFFFTDEHNQKWLFVNKQAAETAPMNSELYIYKTDSLRLDNMQPHTQNPVIIDSRLARNGGAIFKYKNQLYRPSQRNVDGIYGRALNINKIEKLSIDEYVENNIKVIEPDFDNNFVAMHHLHQSDNLFVLDTAYKRK